MALKNLFDMAKADRYTQDGRDELIKAQEAETEDRVYQIGEISQKTGLQKTANGWVKPKKGAAGAKKTAEKHPPKVMPKGMSPAEFTKAWEDDARKHGFEKGQGYEWREYLKKEEEEGEASAKAFADKVHKGEIKYNEETGKFEERKTTESKPAAERKPDGVDEEGNIKIPKAGMNVLVKVNGNRPGKIVSSRGDYVEVEMPARGAYPGRRDTYYKSDLKFDEEMKADALERSDAERATDAAPRQLTGDTRIRVRKA